jgi:hypothetical protein
VFCLAKNSTLWLDSYKSHRRLGIWRCRRVNGR